MCNVELDFATLGAHYGIPFAEHFAAELASLAPLATDRLATLTERDLKVTLRGRMLARTVAMHFDRYLREAQQRRSTHASSDKFLTDSPSVRALGRRNRRWSAAGGTCGLSYGSEPFFRSGGAVHAVAIYNSGSPERVLARARLTLIGKRYQGPLDALRGCSVQLPILPKRDRVYDIRIGPSSQAVSRATCRIFDKKVSKKITKVP